MSNQENIFLKVYRTNTDGICNTAVQFEIDSFDKIVADSVLNAAEIQCDTLSDDTINLNYHRFREEKKPIINVIKTDITDKFNPINYITQVSYTVNITNKSNYVFTETENQWPVKCLNLPDTNLICCQNCETIFATKYQYQRHQCEFNAEKVMLKPEIAGKDVDKASRLRFECEICKKLFVSNNNLERHKNCHKNIQEYVCEHCNKAFVSENRLKIHKENHCKKAGETMKFYRSDVVVWRCDQCMQVFATNESGANHIRTCTSALDFGVKKEDDIKEIELMKVITEMLYQCEFCNRTFADKTSVVQHQQTHTTEMNYECIFCGHRFDSFTLATVHWQNKCNNESNLFYLPKLIYCEHCDRGFKTHEILYNHKNKKKHFTPKKHPPLTANESAADSVVNDNEKAIVKLIENMMNKMDQDSNKENSEIKQDPAEAEVGKKKRGRKRKLPKLDVRRYKKNAADDGCRYQCERCATVYDDIAAMDAHKEVAHASIFNCEQCGQVVHSSKALMIHCRAHQSLKPYVCDQCGRSYSQTSHLWQHMRFHQGIKPFACPHEGCEARYTIRPDLKDHIRKVHTRERPFQCTVCGKCFLTGSVYYQHRLIHSNDRRYGCEVCQKRFFRADALNNHRRIHTDERPYPCPVCGREFRQKGDRNKHLRTQHTL